MLSEVRFGLDGFGIAVIIGTGPTPVKAREAA
jgi:hypothetical protein